MSRCTQYIGLFFPMAPQHGDVFIHKQTGKRFRYDGKYKISSSGATEQDSDRSGQRAKSDNDKSDVFGAWKADGVDDTVAQAAQEKDRNQHNRRHGGGGMQRGDRNQRSGHNNQGNQDKQSTAGANAKPDTPPARQSGADDSGSATPSTPA